MIRFHTQVLERLKATVAERRAAGEYPAHLVDRPYRPVHEAPPDPAAAAPSLRGIRLRHELGFSSKPGVGPVITLAKRAAGRSIHHVVQDALDQAALAIEHLDNRVDDLTFQLEREMRRRMQLEREVARLRDPGGRP